MSSFDEASSTPAFKGSAKNARSGSDGTEQSSVETSDDEIVSIDAAAVSITSEQVPPRSDRGQRQMFTIIGFLLVWTLAYNVFVKHQGVGRAFFQLLDTISDDFVTGSFLAILLGLAIVAVFSITKLYGQIIANVHSFAMLEVLMFTDLKSRRVASFLRKLLTFRDQPATAYVCPRRVGGMLFGLSFIYFMSWVYVVLFSEALFFLSWSSGVDLPITGKNMLLMPTLALSIPFSARVMAYLRYPYAQDYADFMPAAVFGLLIVASLGYLFESGDQKFFLSTIYQDKRFLTDFLTNGIFLAFIPVFFEAAYWLLDVFRRGPRATVRD
jgi:hypothetical protein